MFKSARRCVACGAEAAATGPLLVCPLCVEHDLPRTYFCGGACQSAAWKQHLKWHREMERHLKHTALYVQQQRCMHQRRARTAGSTGLEYDALVADAAQSLKDGDVCRAEETFRMAVALEPDKPTAHHALGCVYVCSGSGRDAAAAYARAAELCSADSTDWANCVSRAFYEFNLCDDSPKPEWWHDEALKRVSARALAAAPAYTTLRMRATVLAADQNDCAWEAGPRTAAELKEAAACWQRTAKLSSDPEAKRVFISRGVECNRQAEEAVKAV